MNSVQKRAISSIPSLFNKSTTLNKSFFLQNTACFNSYSETNRKTVTLIPGDGIGPELIDSVLGVFHAIDAPINWEKFDISVSHTDIATIPQEVISSVVKNGVCLKGPLYTPFITGYSSRNVLLRKALDTYAHVVPCKNLKGFETRHSASDIDFVVIRENTQGEYSGHEQEIVPGLVQHLKVCSLDASLRIARFAFTYAKNNNRKKVTAIHKANIQKVTDGLFLEACKTISQEYPEIEYQEMIVDNTCMQLVMKPEQFDVMLCPNLYGNLVTNAGVGLLGSPALAPGFNFGERAAIFQTGAHHVGADIAGKNLANPTGILLSAAMMLRHLGFNEHGKKIEESVNKTISKKVLTHDMGGNTGTKEFTAQIIQHLRE